MTGLSPYLLYPLLGLCGVVVGVSVDAGARLFNCRSRPKTRFWLTVFFFAVAFPALFYRQVVWQPELLCGGDGGNAVARFFVHAFALAVMVLVSLIDFEHYVIPDLVMIPATVIAVTLMTLFPGAAMPDYRTDIAVGVVSPRVLIAFPHLAADVPRFMLCAGAIGFWVFALLDRRWYPRLGFKRGGLLFLRRLRQSPATIYLPILGLAALAAVWLLYSAPPFERQEAMKTALLSALTGMTASMLLVWGVRLIGGAVLGREAMGFGDVVLMGFLGVLFGWQGGVILFFLAPLAGVVFGVVRLFFRSEREIPYGPFLCLAALALIIFWPSILSRTHDFFIGPFITVIMLAMGVVMALLLWVIQLLKRCFR